VGSFLAFYAFIGFEDMVNVAEEVKDPERNMPRAIIYALVGSSVLYMLVVTAAVLALPIATLSESEAPLALMWENATGTRPTLIAVISLFAVVNGALIQMIMSSRMLYGMGRAGWLPRALAQVSDRTQTPLVATVVVTVGVMIFAMWLPLVTLAKLTSFAILLVFVLVNLSLIAIKRHQPPPPNIRIYPLWVPYGGLLLALALLTIAMLSMFGVLA
jgi:amino acid transporter